MFIYCWWGTNIVRERVGRVADFCFVCRDFRPFRGAKIESVGHFCSIPLGSRTTLGYLRTCESCGCTFRMHPQVYASLSGDRRAGLDSLIVETQPRIWENWYDRLQLERRAREGHLTADERREFLVEPFLLLNGRVEEQARRPKWDPKVTLGLLATVASLFYAIAYFGRHAVTEGDAPKGAAVDLFIVFIVNLLFLIWAVATRTRRFTRRNILPIIVESLRPLSPTAGELEAAVRHLRRMKSPIGKALRVEDVRKAFGTGASKTVFPEIAT